MAVAVFIAILLNCYVRLNVVYEGAFTVYLYLFGVIRIRLYPEREPDRYLSKRKLNRLQRKTRRTAKKKKQVKGKGKSEAKRVTSDLLESVKDLYELVRAIIKRFSYKVKVRIKDLRITVASDDAAKTALIYAGVCNTLNMLTDFFTGYDRIRLSVDSMECDCDYLLQKPTVTTDIEIKVRIKNVIFSVIGVIIDTMDGRK